MWKMLFKPDDEDVASQERDMDMIIAQYPNGVTVALTSSDQLAGSHGPFGFTPNNPIPVNGPIGEAVYIFRLRGNSNSPFLYQRLGSMDSREFSRKLDVYEIVSIDGSDWKILYFSMFHIRRSRRCPDGLRFVSWKKNHVPYGIAAKMGAFGCTCGPHTDFPYCLPRIIRANKNLLQLGPGMPEVCAGLIQKALNDTKPIARPYDLVRLCEQLKVTNWANTETE